MSLFIISANKARILTQLFVTICSTNNTYLVFTLSYSILTFFLNKMGSGDTYKINGLQITNGFKPIIKYVIMNNL